MNKRTDLISIANASLADRLERGKDVQNKQKEQTTGDASNKSNISKRTFKQDIWAAIYTLNIIRYIFGISLLVLQIIPSSNTRWFIVTLNNSSLFFTSTALLLLSAIVFSYLSQRKELEFNHLISLQFGFDLMLTGLLTHSASGIDGNFPLLHILVVATGSVVLPRKAAFLLALMGIMVLFFEYTYSQLFLSHIHPANLLLVCKYAAAIFFSGWLISYLAERIRLNELQGFVPGDQSIEDFLIQEEVNALNTALRQTKGNKTEAAKLLGMSFRSFRYKLTKYDIQ